MKNIFTTFLALTLVAVSFSQTVVTSISALQSAINSAKSGAVIVLANGTYQNSTLSIGTSHITVKAATPGGVYLNGSDAITISGNNVIFSGFQFTSGTITGTAITVSGNTDTLTQLNFNGYDAAHMILISGQYNVVCWSNFQNKPAPNNVNHGGTGDMIQIIPNATNPGYNKIRYCSFQHMPGFGGDFGNECIRIGDGKYSLMISRTVVEYCYFEDTGLGDSESISVKSQENVLRYNTQYNNPNAMFSFRNGDNNVTYSNFFIKSGGIRCKQSNNIYCYNNYFEESGKYQNNNLSGVGTGPIYLEYYGTGFGNNFNIIHNTFYNCDVSTIDNNITNCTWANNIFANPFSAIFTGTNAGQTFAGNIYQGSLGIAAASGFKSADPLLALNSDKYYGLTASSPAIGGASASYPAILNIPTLSNDPTLLFDIKGQSRPATVTLKDVGCDQYGAAGTVINRPLAIGDVGPSYLMPVTTPVSLVSFAAKGVGKNVLLTWETNKEINNFEFEIERSTNGISFVKIGTLKATRNTNTSKSYSFTDNTPLTGINYYRLKQIDLNGVFTYSKVDSYDNSKLISYTIYPNPVKNQLTISNLNKGSNYSITNTSGRVVLSGIAEPNERIQIVQLPSGTYFINVDNTTLKFIKE